MGPPKTARYDLRKDSGATASGEGGKAAGGKQRCVVDIIRTFSSLTPVHSQPSNGGLSTPPITPTKGNPRSAAVDEPGRNEVVPRVSTPPASLTQDVRDGTADGDAGSIDPNLKYVVHVMRAGSRSLLSIVIAMSVGCRPRLSHRTRTKVQRPTPNTALPRNLPLRRLH